MLAGVGLGLPGYASTREAARTMAAGPLPTTTYTPDPARRALYNELYHRVRPAMRCDCASGCARLSMLA